MLGVMPMPQAPKGREQKQHHTRRREQRMGLGVHLNDVSADSIPFLLLTFLASSLSLLRSALHILLTISDPYHRYRDPNPVYVSSSALPDHPAFEYGGDGDADDRVRCVVCLCRLRRGDLARRLPCSHLFHQHCVDGWVDRSNLTCPLCRAPIRTGRDERHGGGDLGAWFAQPAQRLQAADPDGYVDLDDRQVIAN